MAKRKRDRISGIGGTDAKEEDGQHRIFGGTGTAHVQKPEAGAWGFKFCGE